MNKNRLFVFLLMVFTTVFSVSAQEVSLKGTQIRGQGKDGKLICSGINLPSGGIITAATTNGAGFWIEGSSGVNNFQAAANAVNFKLAPGTYKVYPNLGVKQNQADVTLKIKASGAVVPPASTSGSSIGNPAGKNIIGNPAGKNSTGNPAGKNITGNPAGKDIIGNPAGKNITGNPAGKNTTGNPAGKDIIGNPAGKNIIGNPAGKNTTGNSSGKNIIGNPTSKGPAINISNPKPSTPTSGGAINQTQPKSGQSAPGKSGGAPLKIEGVKTIKFGEQKTINLNP